MNSYEAKEWYDVPGRGWAVSVMLDTSQPPKIGDTVAIDTIPFTVSGIEKEGINRESWKGHVVGLLVSPRIARQDLT